ncbi:MAG: ribonuclease H-like domain-containing protein [Deltaproteobacteria bacterium]|nr:ribonuclease H-like domain-containing protein [Deltaproteobacteria bacterium]
MKIACPFCKQPYEIEAENLDRNLECSTCNRTFSCAIGITPLIGTVYLDVETTASFTNPNAEISTIVWWCDQQWHSWVNGQDNPAEFLLFWQHARQIVTFNGKTFDEPKITRQFGVHPHPNHVDLMHEAKKHGLTGGLKEIGETCEFPRPPELDKVGGKIAVKLWKRFRHDNIEEALQNLLYYNAWDVVLTYYLHCRCSAVQAAPIHNSIPFILNPGYLSSVVPEPKRPPTPRKKVGNFAEFWAERKRNPITTIRGAEVCITGDLINMKMEKEEAKALIETLGGTYKTSASLTLDFLVVGDTREFGQTGKIKKAEENINRGAHTRIIGEADFLELIRRTKEV